jgi:methylated-DNA-[protein]-cysteine S-methyltransferase
LDQTNLIYYVVLNTKSGWIGISGSQNGIKQTTLPQPSKEQAEFMLGRSINDACYSASYFRDIVERYKAYFDGQKVDFTIKLDFSEATVFERKAWETTSTIPYGETRSYAWVARQIEKPLASRGVGQAMRRNPFPIIVPCHRVIASDGKLRGFGGGLVMKQYLLDLEAKKN